MTSLKQADQVVTMQGMAQFNRRVSEMLRNLTNNTLVLQARAGGNHCPPVCPLSPKDQRRVASFSLRFRLVHSSGPQRRTLQMRIVAGNSHGQEKAPKYDFARSCKAICSASFQNEPRSERPIAVASLAAHATVPAH